MAVHVVAKLIDVSRPCIGCKACEAACQEWQDQPFPDLGLTTEAVTRRFADLRPRFLERHQVQRDSKSPTAGVAWHMAKFQCMHCVDAGCITACPAPGAIFRHDNGTVDFDHDKCIGCGYCIAGCPFDIPKLSPVTQKVYKCTLCSDRTAVGLEPACVKACPTNCLSYGSRSDLVQIANARAETLRGRRSRSRRRLQSRGCGRHERALRAEGRKRSRAVTACRGIRGLRGPSRCGRARSSGSAISPFAGTIFGALFHYLRFGPKPEEKEAADV